MSESFVRRAWILGRKRAISSVVVVIMLVLVSAAAIIVSSNRPNAELKIVTVSANPAETYVAQDVEWAVVVGLQYNGERGNGLTFTWDWDDGTYTVNHLASVNASGIATDVQTHAWVEPGLYEVTVSVWDDYGSEDNRYQNVSATVPFIVNEGITTRSVDYSWYDMFAHPLGPWYEHRLMNYGNEYAVTDSYPYIYVKEDAPPGNVQVNTFMRLDVDANDIPEVNMDENPEFLPYFGTARGGNANIDWLMDYLTWDEAQEKLGPGTLAWYDGWLIGLNGSVVLDRDAAKAVLGLSDSGFDDFDTWWAYNGAGVKNDWKTWLNNEASNDRLAIFNMYEYDLTFVYFDMDAVKALDKVIIQMDTVSWGMEALMTRWLHEAFMPTEWYMEEMYLSAAIGPDDSDMGLSAAVGYALTASETIEDGAPCWVWQAMLQDYRESSLEYPISDFDPYADMEIFNTYPGNEWYHTMMPYDYTPGAWNLSEGETLSFEWPAGEVLFLEDDPTGAGSGMVYGALDFWSAMTVDYFEPMPTDAPGNVAIDTDERRMEFTGPFDMWTWSEGQVAHSYLSDEWDRLGILPYGMPYIEFRATGERNTPPTASFTVTPEVGTVDTLFSFDASSSFDLEDPAESLMVRWDWESDGVWDTTFAVDKTAEHQYSIDDTYTVVLEVMDSGDLRSYASENVSVLESSILTPHDPIHIYGDADFTAENGVVSGSGTYSDPYVIKRWSINASQADAIRIEGTTSFFIVRNVEVFDGELLLDGFEANDGVALSDVSNGRVESVTAWNCRYGISVFDSYNVAIASNVVYFNNFSGLCLHNCDSVTAYGNYVHNNTVNGIIVGYSSNCSVAGNWVEYTGWNGYAHYSIEIWRSESCEAVGNHVANGGTGIGLSTTNDCTIADNRITNHSGRAVYLDSSDYSDVTGNEVASISTSIYAFNCRFTTIADNELTPLAGDLWSADIKCDSCFDTVVIGNAVTSGTGSGIQFYGSTNSSVVQNNVVADGGYGIRFYYSTDSVVVDNVVATEGGDGIILLFCGGSVVTGNVVTSNVKMAIVLHTCENSSVVNNVALSNHYGIYLTSCANSSVVSNRATSNNETGIYISMSTETEVTSNSASSGGDKWWTGCMILSLLTDAVVTCNTVIGGLHGILVSDSTGVILYHNDFINNTVHAYDNRGAENSWDNGYPDGGNHWSSYDGIDERSGVNQDEPGPDGIGDTPFVIDSNSTDRYPLMEGSPITEPSLTYTIYDIFEEPWGPWWDARVASPVCDTERILTEDAGDVTYLYSLKSNPKGLDDQGLIYAPYRWNIDATSIPNMDVHAPVLMPLLGSGKVLDAEATVDVFAQYVYPGPGTWWDDYWVSTWSGESDWVGDSFVDYTDGYYLGTVYTVTMNRAAAEEWMGMPMDEVPADWWAANGDIYESLWQDWIVYQGNEVFSIFNGYEWPYYDLGTFMSLTGDSTEVVLDIAHLSWGWEALLTRWLNYTQLSVHQPYFEDITVQVDYRDSVCDFYMDAVCQWSLHAVKQNASAPGDSAPCAWAWEPIGLDFVPSTAMHPESTYDPYYGTTYRSWNSGDPLYGTEVPYEVAPSALSLPSYAKLVIELPMGDALPGYYAEPVPDDAIMSVWHGDTSDYDAIRYYGEMDLGFALLDGCTDWTYDPVSKVMTINGPWDFTNPRGDGYLYHGAPWIEFNVIPMPSNESLSAEGSAAALELCPAAASVGGELASLVGTMCAVMLATVAMAAGMGRRREC